MQVSLMSSWLAATVPPDFRETLIATVVAGLVAFAVCGGILAGFIRSLSRESDQGEIRFTSRSAWWLAALIAALVAFSIALMWIGLGPE